MFVVMISEKSSSGHTEQKGRMDKAELPVTRHSLEGLNGSASRDNCRTLALPSGIRRSKATERFRKGLEGPRVPTPPARPQTPPGQTHEAPTV